MCCGEMHLTCVCVGAPSHALLGAKSQACGSHAAPRLRSVIVLRVQDSAVLGAELQLRRAKSRGGVSAGFFMSVGVFSRLARV